MDELELPSQMFQSQPQQDFSQEHHSADVSTHVHMRHCICDGFKNFQRKIYRVFKHFWNELNINPTCTPILNLNWHVMFLKKIITVKT